ncbi:MAG: DUF2341 domain-containing protein, partial [Myxococcales bacterium]|nr:DUF2341 domain-containing protein [Myxococcales bacterium]
SDGAERVCEEGCAAGFFGADCGGTCLAGHCATTLTCDQGDGSPLTCDGCADGFWGVACETACAHDHCETVLCDATTGAVSACPSCEPGFFGPLCESQWWDRAWGRRAPLALDVTAQPAEADVLQLPVDVDRVCYGVDLPPVLYAYHFDSDTAGHVTSLDGHGGRALLDHGATLGAGHTGQGLHFDGASFVDLPDVTPSATAFTLSLWVKVDRLPTTGYNPVVTAWKDGEIYDLGVVDDASVCHEGNTTGSALRAMAQVHPVGLGEPNLCSEAISLDTWTFLALTFDGRVEKLYVNGALAVTYDYGQTGTLARATDLRLGVHRDGAVFFKGVMDDVTLLDGAVDAAGVAALMSPLCQRDLADVRIYDDTAHALLPVWVEAADRVWVSAPADVASHELAIYYDNPHAAPVSDGRAVFPIFEDFEGAALSSEWSVDDGGCAGFAVADGVVRTQGCGTVQRNDTNDAEHLVAAVDVHRVGATAATCFDARLVWTGLTGSVAARFSGADAVAVGFSEDGGACGVAAGAAPDPVRLGTLALVQPADADTYAARYTSLFGVAATTTPAPLTASKGALRLDLQGAVGSVVEADNLRAYTPTVATATVGDPEVCAAVEGLDCCVASDCAGGFSCVDGACEARYQWVDAGPAGPTSVTVATCDGVASQTLACDADVVGAVVSVAGGDPAVRFVDVGAAGSGGVGSLATTSDDATELTWDGQGGACTGAHAEMRDVGAVWECLYAYEDCVVDAECASRVCREGACQDPSCADGAMNGDETDIDCGGSCQACAVGETCASASDCASAICAGTCVATCTSSAQCLPGRTCSGGACYSGFRWVNSGTGSRKIIRGACSGSQTTTEVCDGAVLGQEIHTASGNVEWKPVGWTGQGATGGQGYSASGAGTASLSLTGGKSCGSDSTSTETVTIYTCQGIP